MLWIAVSSFIWLTGGTGQWRPFWAGWPAPGGYGKLTGRNQPHLNGETIPQTGRTYLRSASSQQGGGNARDIETRVFQECRDGGRCSGHPVHGCAGTARQSAGHADRMPDLAREENDRQATFLAPSSCLPAPDFRPSSCARPWVTLIRVSRGLAKYKGAELRRILGDAGGQVRELALRYRGTAERYGGQDCLGGKTLA